MNLHPSRDAFATPIRPSPDVDYTAEQSIIARVLMAPDNSLAEVAAKLQPKDFAHPFHARVISSLMALVDEGRTPSIQAILAVVGSGEIEPGLSVRGYLLRLVSHHGTENLLPLADAIEVVRDTAQRNALSVIGSTLAARAAGQDLSVGDMASDAVHALDDVMSALRQGKRRTYDAQGAVDIALEHYASDARPYPTTGLADLDRMIGGWPLGQLSIVAGRPGMGKSAIATSFVLSAAKAGHGVAFFSLEMRGEQLGSRIVCDLAYQADDPIHYDDILNRRPLSDRNMRRLVDARERLTGLPVMMDEQSSLTVAEISSRSRKLANSLDRDGRRLSAVFIDHMGIMEASSRYRGNRVNEVTEITAGLAALAKELDVAVIALCQLNRAVEGRENKRPGLSDLRDSGSIEQDASVVVFAYRPAYYLKQRQKDAEEERKRLELLEAEKNKLELYVAKNRNGQVGPVDVFVDIGANAIRNAAQSWRAP